MSENLKNTSAGILSSPLLFGRSEAAKLLQISTATLDREVKAGRISYHRIGDRPLFSIQCIQEYLESRKRPAIAKRGQR